MDRSDEIRAEIARLEKWMLTWEFQAKALSHPDSDVDLNAEWEGEIADLRDELNEIEDAETEQKEAA